MIRTSPTNAPTHAGRKFLAYGQTPADLLDVLIPEYKAKTEPDRLQARIRLAIDAQVRLQASINAEASPEDLAALSPEEHTALTAPRFEQPAIDFWHSVVPVVLVDTGYAPYTEINRPISGISDVQNPPNITWLTPRDEWDLIESLANAGYIVLHEAIDL